MVYKYSKGESNGKAETEFSGLLLPSRVLYSTNIAKGESNGKRKTWFSKVTDKKLRLQSIKTTKRPPHAAQGRPLCKVPARMPERCVFQSIYFIVTSRSRRERAVGLYQMSSAVGPL